MNWRITSWNVNGLRAVFIKNGFDWLNTVSPDILCLQEAKAYPHQIAEEQLMVFEGYQADWNPAQRAGYSGVVTIARKPALEKRVGLLEKQFGGEGRVIVSRYPDFYLYNIYFPNGQRDHGRLTYKLDFYASLLEECDALHAKGEAVILCGDFNTAHQEIDLRNPKQNQNTSGFLPEERAWLTKVFDDLGWVDVFRTLNAKPDQYTWWSNRGRAYEKNVGWRIDYQIATPGIAKKAEKEKIYKDKRFSDHAPLIIDYDYKL